MTVFRNDGQWDRSNVEFREGRIRAYDKRSPTPSMMHIDYGLGIFRAEAFRAIPVDEPYDLDRLYPRLLETGQLAACEVAERFYEVGSPSGLEDTRRYLAGRA
jgi:NDP-sugar pyrophosphorylase family protein